MGIARLKPDDGHHLSGQAFEFERSPLLGRFIVDFDPGPELNIGIYSDAEFDATFDVIQE